MTREHRRRRGPSLRRDHRPGHAARRACRRSGAIGASSSTPRTSADATPSCRCSAWCRRRSSASIFRGSSRAAGPWPRRAGKTIPAIPGSRSARSWPTTRWPDATSSRSLLPDAWRTLGAWIEQLVAESTGKDGRGVLPVVDEPLGAIQEYREDRAFVVVLTPEAKDGTRLRGTAGTGAAPGASPHAVWNRPRRGVLPLGVRDGRGGRRDRREPVRRTQRARRQSPDAGTARYASRDRPFPAGPAVRSPGGLPPPRPPPGGRSGTRGGASGPYLAILDYLPADPRRLALVRRASRGAARRRTTPSRPTASDRATSTRPASTTRADRQPAASCCSRRPMRARRRCPAPTTRSAR